MRTSRWAAAALPVLLLAASALAGVAFDLDYSVGGFGIGKEAFDRPVDVVEDKKENIYVLDQGNNRIQVLDRRGRFVREWGGRGFTPGQFDTPNALTIDPAGNIYVADTLNHRIQKFDPNGKLLVTLGRLGSGDGEFNKPMDVHYDPGTGDLFIIEATVVRRMYYK